MTDKPISEVYRLAAKAWVEKEAAASLLEETKSSVLSERMAALGDVPVSRAEMTVKASPDWREFVTKMVEARREANLAKVRLKWVEMTFTEKQSADATRRAEMKL